jgi:hypothetical protein
LLQNMNTATALLVGLVHPQVALHFEFFCVSYVPGQCLTNDWTTRVRSLAQANNLSLASVSRPALRPTQLPIQWVPGVKRSRGVMLTTHPHLVPRSMMIRSYKPTSSPPWRLYGDSGLALLYFTLLYVHALQC